MERQDYGVLLLSILPFEEFPLADCLGIEWLNAILLREGYPSRALVEKAVKLDFERMVEETRGVKFLGYSMYSETADHTFELAAALKKVRPDLHICVGGPVTLFCAQQILQDCEAIDSVAVGEAFDTIVEMMDCLRVGQPLALCKGVYYRAPDGELCWTSHRSAVEDLDDFPFPTRTLIKEDRGALAHSVISSQGCPANCTYCTETAIFNLMMKLSPGRERQRVRARRVDKVVEEMARAVEETGCDTFEIDDSSFEGFGPMGKSRLDEFAGLLIERKVPCYFMCNFRAESFTREKDAALIDKLSRAGLSMVFTGAESGYEQTLRYFRKIARVKQNIAVINLFRELGVNMEIGFIMLHPHSTFEELRANVQFLEESDFAWDIATYYSDLALFPGEPLIEIYRKEGGILKDSLSYRKPYEYNFLNPEVDALVEYLREASAVRDASFEVSHPILELGTLIAKLRKHQNLSRQCEQWYEQLVELRRELGSCNSRWYLACIATLEDDPKRVDLLNEHTDEWARQKERGGFVGRIEGLKAEIVFELSLRGIPYFAKASPWGDVIYPAHPFAIETPACR